MIEGDDGQPGRRKHHGVAGLADRLTAGQQQQIATRAAVEILCRIGFRLERGLRVQCIHYWSCPTGRGRRRTSPKRGLRHVTFSRKNDSPSRPEWKILLSQPAWEA